MENKFNKITWDDIVRENEEASKKIKKKFKKQEKRNKQIVKLITAMLLLYILIAIPTSWNIREWENIIKLIWVSGEIYIAGCIIKKA